MRTVPPGDATAALAAAAGVIFLLVGCTATGDHSGGVAAYVDPVSGRQVVIEVPASEAAPALPSLPSTEAASTRQSYGLPIADDAEYIDADVLDRELLQRDGERFFVLPDGTGVTRPVAAADLGAVRPSGVVDAGSLSRQAAIPQGEIWRTCSSGPVLPVLPVGAERRHVLSFPAVSGERRHAGYRIPVPAGRQFLELWSVVRGDGAVMPVLAQVDGQGRVVAVAYSVPTQTQPETPFRYARLGFRLILPAIPPDGSLVVLDAALVQALLPPDCRPVSPPDIKVRPVAGGTMTLDFPD